MNIGMKFSMTVLVIGFVLFSIGKCIQITRNDIDLNFLALTGICIILVSSIVTIGFMMLTLNDCVEKLKNENATEVQTEASVDNVEIGDSESSIVFDIDDTGNCVVSCIKVY